MKRICCLAMIVLWSMGGVKADIRLPEAVKIESKRLYQILELEEVIGLQAFQQALAGYLRYDDGGKGLLVVIDFTRPSTVERFCVIDLLHLKVLYKSHVAHGRRSGGNYAVSFSNQPGSFMSSLGFFRTGNTYYGKNGYSLWLDGLEQGINDKARERAIVIHGAPYADPLVLKGQKRLGRSLGCPALPPAISGEVIEAIKEGAILYIYGQNKA